jgi:hypothetical protein
MNNVGVEEGHVAQFKVGNLRKDGEAMESGEGIVDSGELRAMRVDHEP